MRCLFCKADSSASGSIEHIIPEALGNTLTILPPGVVCDRCNNYFGVKVEQPLLHRGYLFDLRARQGLPSKRRRLMQVIGEVVAGESFDAMMFRTGPERAVLGLANLSDAPSFWKAIEGRTARFVQGASEELDRRLFSRLIAKIALELLAQRIHTTEGWEEFAIDHPQFDPIRAYARYGTGPDWPIHSRRIYDEGATIALPSGETRQMMYECDILLTDMPEAFGVVCLFGMEHAINLTRRDVSGFVDWVRANVGVSPLYKGIGDLP